MTTSWIFRKTGWVVEILLKSQGLGTGALSKSHKITPGKQCNGDCSRWFVLSRGMGPPHTFSTISSVPVKQTLTYISAVSTTATLGVLWLQTTDHAHGEDVGIRVSEKLYLWPTVSESWATRWATELMWPEIWFHCRGLRATVVVLLYQNNPPQ